MKKSIVFITSHPIQYQVPVFRCLAVMPDIKLTVLFAMVPDAVAQGSGFGAAFEWDIPLLEGYTYEVLDNVSRMPSVVEFSGCDTPGVRVALQRLQPDALVVNGWNVKTSLQALVACKRLGIPCLVRGEANDLRNRPAWKRWLQGLLVRRFTACLFIGQANRKFYLARGVTEEHLFPSLYCIENERFSSAALALESERELILASWKIPNGSACFLFCGKFEEKKHPLELLTAFRRAHEVNPSIHLLMVGDGELRFQCESFVSQNRLPVTFTGFLNQSEIANAYVASDCLVLPSDTGETWGLVVNEAMACGRPAIVSDLVGCASDLVSPGVTGNIFPFGDWNALADQFVAASNSREKLAEMGKNASARVASFSPLAAAQGIRDAVHAVTG